MKAKIKNNAMQNLKTKELDELTKEFNEKIKILKDKIA